MFAWGAIAAGFFVLSLDEMGSLHERLGDHFVVRLLLPELGFLEGWAAVFTLPLLLVAVALLWAAWTWFRTIPWVLPLLAVGVLLYLTVPVQEHLEVASGAANRHANALGRPAWQIVLEEGTELLATLCFLSAGLRFAEHRSRALRRLDGKIGLEIGSTLPLAAIATAILAMAAFHVCVPDLVRPSDGQGVPSNWYPATAAFLASLLAVHLAAAEKSRVGTPPGSLLALRALAGVNLILSASYAADFPVHHLLDDRLGLQSGWMFAVGAGVLVTGMFTARISNSGIVAAGLLIWSAGFLMRPLLDLGTWASLSLLSQLALLGALAAMLVERARPTWVVQEGKAQNAESPIWSRRETA